MTETKKISLFQELKRRNVFRVAAAFVVVAWLLIQLVDILVPMFSLPDWTDRLIVLLLVIAFPVALLFAWAFELTPEGIKLEKHVERGESITQHTGRKLDYSIIAVLAAALMVSMYANFNGDDEVDDEAVAAGPSKPLSIAVLPFANRSAEEADIFFVDGMHDDLLTRLAKISALKVISRTSVMQYRDTEKSMKTIGDELGVTTLLEGGVQRAGNRIRINMQLIDAETDEHLWAETYDRELNTENIFEIQGDIARMIADALHAVLSPAEQQRIAGQPTDNLQALEAYMIGRQKLSKRTGVEVRASIIFFERAVAADPNFAEAYASLAEAYIVQNNIGDLALDQMFKQAWPVVNKARSINPDLGIVYTVWGGLVEYEGDAETAEEYYRKAIELSPSYVTAYIWLALLHEYQFGNPLEAIVLYEKALELDPVMIVQRTNLASTLSAAGRPEEAMQVVRDALDINSRDGFMHSAASRLLAQQDGRLADALAWSQRAASLGSRYSGDVAWGYVALGDFDSAKPWHEWYERDYPDGVQGPWLSIEFLRATGQQREAAKMAEELFGFTLDVYSLDYPLRVIRDDLLDDGRIDDTIDRYREHFPEFFLPEPAININSVWGAVDLALLLKLSGQNDVLDTLAKSCFDYMQTMPRMAILGMGLLDVELHAILGNRDAAIESLAEAVAAGYTRYHGPLRPERNFESIRDDPEFTRLMGIIQERVATELAKVREMEQAGELARTPEELPGVQFDLSL